MIFPVKVTASSADTAPAVIRMVARIVASSGGNRPSILVHASMIPLLARAGALQARPARAAHAGPMRAGWKSDLGLSVGIRHPSIAYRATCPTQRKETFPFPLQPALSSWEGVMKRLLVCLALLWACGKLAT